MWKEARQCISTDSFAISARSIRSPWRGAVDALGEDAWHDYVRRQEKFEPHRQTLSIPLLYDDDMRHADPTPWDRLAALDPVIQPVLDTIRARPMRPRPEPRTRAISSGSSSPPCCRGR